MTYPNQIELDFVAWLDKLSAKVKWSYERWVEDEEGNEEEGVYCPDCADTEARKLGEGHSVHGWDEHHESDSPGSCDACGVLLHHSPTRYLIEEDIALLAKAKEMSAWDAAVVHNWLDGMGDYRRAEDWPKMERHAIRLMKAAGLPVAKRGTIRFTPSDLLRCSGRTHGYPSWNTLWLLAYEHIARKLAAWGNGCHLEALSESSGWGPRDFEPLVAVDAHCRHLASLFRHAGLNDDRGKFLASLGIRRWAHLDRPITIADVRPESAEGWMFEVQGRTLRRPGPNECHPEALTIQRGRLRFSVFDLCWRYELVYGYPHDSSSWTIGLKQRKSQSLPKFFAALKPWVEAQLEPELDGRARLYRLREWGRVYEALREVFYFELDKDQVSLVDRLITLDGSSLREHRLDLSKGNRLALLRRWLAEDVREATPKGAKSCKP